MHSEVIEMGERRITLETGQMARQANGAVVVREGKSFLLATVVSDLDSPPRADFLPLTVDYREKMAAASRIPGNYFRREGRITESEILTSRLIDRTLRPLFPKGFQQDTQVAVTVYSADDGSDLPSLALIGAATAIQLSDVPFNGPVAGLRVGRLDGKFVALPAPRVMMKSDVDVIVSASRDGLVMAEGELQLVSDAALSDAFAAAQRFCEPVLAAITRLAEATGRTKRQAAAPPPPPNDLPTPVRDEIIAALDIGDKQLRRRELRAIKKRWCAADEGDDAARSFEATLAREMRQRTIVGPRIGGRTHDEIRAITIQTGLLPNSNGSALFTRGETQALVTATLGGDREARKVETLFGPKFSSFMLHYNFPSFSVGETRPNRGPGRREIGHGNLAERALEPVLPSLQDFPFTIRVVSDITESNGSSSMATVCGGALALVNAGVPLKAPVAGIAMGLIKADDHFVILSDILGDEDHLGDMDFKVAGTADRVTAVQLDNKLGSLPPEVLEAALDAARRGRAHILREMAPHLGASDAPSFETVEVAPHKRAAIIGPGGKTIQGIQRDTSTRIEVKNDGRVHIFGEDPEGVRAARARIEELTFDLVTGGVYRARVRSIKDFGAFVRIGGHEGLVHVSELDEGRVDEVSAIVTLDEEILVRVLGVDERGRLRLSRRAALGEDPTAALNPG